MDAIVETDKQADPSQLSIELLKSVLSTQAGYGRWLVNTLWLMHSGAISGLVVNKDKFHEAPHLSLLCFVIGVVLGFIAAFAMWWSFSYALLEVNNALKAGRWPDWDKRAMRAYHAAALFGFASLVCLAVGGLAAWWVWAFQH
jgi:hypothetical protein